MIERDRRDEHPPKSDMPAALVSIAFLTNIPAPYRPAMVEAWSRALAGQAKISVFYTHCGDQGRGWKVRPIEGVDEHRLRRLMRIPGYGVVNLGLLRMVLNHDLILIGGFEQASYLVAALLGRLAGKKIVLLFDGFSPKRIPKERLLTRLLKKLTVALCHAYFANGTIGFNYLKRHRAEPRRVFNQFLCVPGDELEQALAAGMTRARARSLLGLPQSAWVVGFSGYFIARKRLDLLIRAVAAMPPERRPLLVFVGTGPLEADLRRQATAEGVNVRFLGFRHGEQLAQSYIAMDLLVLPSDDDPWGLVVNEAMIAGLPVIVSDACGCAVDLVDPGVNGFVFRSGDVGDLGWCISTMLDGNLAAMGQASRTIVGGWTPGQSGRSMREMLSFLFPGFHGHDVVVLHETDGRKYFEALVSLAKDGTVSSLEFYESSVIRHFLRMWLKRREGLTKALSRAVRNLRFRLGLPCLKGKTVVLGIAPWDFRILLHYHLHRRNRLIYHTSWPYWEDGFVPRKYGPLTPLLRRVWLSCLGRRDIEVVAVTNAAAEAVAKAIAGKPVAVIPHTVSAAFFAPMPRQTQELFRLTYVGELIAQKGIELLPALLDTLSDLRVHLDIVGDGPLAGFVREQLQVRGNVAFHGRIADRGVLAGILASSHLLVLPSLRTSTWEELFGMVIIEAMAVGVPTLASDHIGPRSVIRNGFNGLLAEDGNVRQLSQLIRGLYLDRDAWRLMSDRARESGKNFHLLAVAMRWRLLLERRGLRFAQTAPAAEIGA